MQAVHRLQSKIASSQSLMLSHEKDKPRDHSWNQPTQNKRTYLHVDWHSARRRCCLGWCDRISNCRNVPIMRWTKFESQDFAVLTHFSTSCRSKRAARNKLPAMHKQEQTPTCEHTTQVRRTMGISNTCTDSTTSLCRVWFLLVCCSESCCNPIEKNLPVDAIGLLCPPLGEVPAMQLKEHS